MLRKAINCHLVKFETCGSHLYWSATCIACFSKYLDSSLEQIYESLQEVTASCFFFSSSAWMYLQSPTTTMNWPRFLSSCHPEIVFLWKFKTNDKNAINTVAIISRKGHSCYFWFVYAQRSDWVFCGEVQLRQVKEQSVVLTGPIIFAPTQITQSHFCVAYIYIYFI